MPHRNAGPMRSALSSCGGRNISLQPFASIAGIYCFLLLWASFARQGERKKTVCVCAFVRDGVGKVPFLCTLIQSQIQAQAPRFDAVDDSTRNLRSDDERCWLCVDCFRLTMCFLLVTQLEHKGTVGLRKGVLINEKKLE
eukprot:GEMP01090761.1.p1 GENE.GEMP01090761.1~~GEMP01090761.1.p1  ORF type:complete len:140 (+),score=21.69 GEMP01090761.1:142-561(+)